MLISCKEREGAQLIHVVNMDSQTTLCGRPDLGMGATGTREVTCPACTINLSAIVSMNRAAGSETEGGHDGV